MKGLLKLLQSSSGLQDLKLHASSHWHWHGGGLHETIFPQDIKDLYRCKSLGRLRFLDLQGINCARQPQKVFEFLSTLQSLETFVFKLSSDMMYQEEPLAWTGEKDGFLPALQDVDVSEYVLLHGILHYSKPKVVRSLNCTHFCEGEDFFTDVLTLPLFPSGCDSVEEVHLSIPSDEFTNGAVSISFVEALRTIPSNVKRLNIYHDGTDKVVLSHDSIEQDVLKGLDHLTGLTRLILPWTCNLHESKALGEDKEVAVDKRAAKIAVSLNLPSLEYVFFQGSNVIDPVTDSPKWKASFNEKEDLHKRWIVKIEREPAVAGDGEQCDGDCRIGFCEWCKDLDWSTSLRVSAGVKIATVISSSCTYDECWMVEELDLEKRKCLEDQRGSSA